MERCLCILAVMLLYATPLEVRAQDAKEQAKAAFGEGVEHFKDSRYEQAVVAFRRAQELHPTWKLHFNIGQCEAALKNYGLALDAFEAYLVDGGDEISEERQEEVQRELDRLSRLSGELEVEAPDGAVIHVDNRERGRMPLPGPIRVAAGLHQVKVIRGEEVLAEQAMRITGRGKSFVKALPLPPSKEKEVVATTDEEPPPAEEPPAEKDTSRVATWGWILGGVGAALAITGAVTGGAAVSKHGELEDACPEKVCASQSDYDLREQVDSLKLATDVLLPVGGAMVVAGIVMVVVGKKGEREEARLRLAPLVASGQGGLFLEGRF